MMPDLQQAIAAIKAGDKAAGKQLLIEVIKADPRNESAWLWMTQCVSTDEERLRCLQNALRINPNSEQAKRGLAALQQRQASQQPAPPKVEAPPKPIELTPKPKPSLPPNQLQALDLAELRAQLEQAPPPDPPISPRPLKTLKQEATKKCPYCAETIKAEAKVCRFCGKDLEAKRQQPQAEQEKQQPQTKRKKSNVPILLGLILFICVALCVCPALFGSRSSSKQLSLPTASLPTATTQKKIDPTPTAKPLGWTGVATEYAFHSFRIGRRGTYLGGVLLDGKGQIEVYLGHGQDIDNLELVADCNSYDEVGCAVGFILDLREGEHFFKVTSDGPYTLALKRQ